MSTDALLTLAAAIIAVLALMSSEARDDLRLRITPLTVTVAVLAMVVLVGIKLTPVWESFGYPTLGPWRWGFDPEIASFVTIAIATAISIVRVATVRLTPRRIEAFSELSERLLFSGKHAQLLFLLERHFDALEYLLESKHVTSRLRKALEPESRIQAFISGKRAGGTETLAEWKVKQRHPITRVRRQLASLLPDYDERRKRAKRLLERVFLSEPFVEYVSKARPDFALVVPELKVAFFSERYLDMLVTAWMRNPNSVLYEETEQNQNTRDGHRYKFDQLNPVLWHLFGDPFRAEKLAIYKPVGDFVLRELERLRRLPEEDVHRRPETRFIDEGRWRAPIYLGLRLFDFWISESLHRGSHWHGWLMYWESAVEDIVANMANLERIDQTREFPTPYHYLLYEIFAAFGNWIDDGTRIDQKLESVKVERLNLDAEAVLKSAVVSLARMLRTVLESRNVNMEFKARALVWVLEWYEGAVKRDDLKEVYRLAIERGGQRFGAVEPYHDALRRTIPEIDRTRLYAEPGEELLEWLEQKLGG